jgi:hypothetical protein
MLAEDAGKRDAGDDPLTHQYPIGEGLHYHFWTSPPDFWRRC